MNDTTAYEAAFPNRKLTGIDQRIAGVIAELHALADEMGSAFRVFPEARVAEAVSPSEEVEETAVEFGCAYVDGTGRECHGLPFDEVHTCRGSGSHHPHMLCHPFAPRPTPSSPSEPTTVEPLEGEWRRVSELLGHGVWDINHGTHGETVRVPLAVEQAIAAHFAMEQYDLLKARAERAEERASTAERRLEGHENLAVAAIRERDGMERMWLMTEDVLRETRAERDEARGEVERLQAALTRIRDKSSVPCGICPVDAPCSNCIARRALMEARVSTPVREERGE